MMQKIVTLLAGGVLFLFCFMPAYAKDGGKHKALANLTTAKAYYDVNIGIPEKLLVRLELIDKTFDQLVEVGVKPDFIVGFRGKASDFVTKGKDYVLEEDLETKKKVHEWLTRFKERGIAIEQCKIAAGLRDIDAGDFLEHLEVVENGYISMIGYQAQGYSQIPMD